MKSLEEQIAGKCINFTGLMDKVCKAGVSYSKFPNAMVEGFPCLKGEDKGKTCEFCQFPSPEEVEKKLERINHSSTRVIKALIAAKAHYKTNKQPKATIKCPHGDHDLIYTVAEINGHMWLHCPTCDIRMME